VKGGSRKSLWLVYSRDGSTKTVPREEGSSEGLTTSLRGGGVLSPPPSPIKNRQSSMRAAAPPPDQIQWLHSVDVIPRRKFILKLDQCLINKPDFLLSYFIFINISVLSVYIRTWLILNVIRLSRVHYLWKWRDLKRTAQVQVVN